jgi:O-antigen ligase
MAGPKNLFDFAFFRLNEFKESTVMINYQSLGLNLCIALSFLLARKNITLSTKILLIVLLFLTTLYTGSRQSIFGFLLIVFVGYYLSRKKKYLLFLLIVAAIYLVLVYWFIVYMKIELFNVLIKSDNLIEASGRSNLIDRGIELFKQSPLFGVGYGRYSINSTYKIYPHNIFIELLCELGIIGSIAIWSSFLMPFRKVIAIAKENKFSSLLIMLLLSFFVRALVSSDFSTNIQIFALLFSVLIVKQHAKLPNRLNSRQVLIIKERKHDILMESSIR